LIFLDTGFLYALIDADDAHHARVREVLEEERGRRLSDFVVTTNHVLAETLTLLRKRGREDARTRHARAVEVGRQLYAGTFGRIHHVTAEEENAAFDYFSRHADHVYSFVDCTAFVVMEKLGIREAWAVDRDFTHRFIARPGPAT
jgi:predicted nucleic acid-binding protein